MKKTKIKMPGKQPTNKRRSDTPNKEHYITNFSSKTVTIPQIDVLSLCSNFVPSRNAMPTKLLESLDDFNRRSRLKYFFEHHAAASTEAHPFRGKNTQPASPSIEAHLKRIRSRS